MSRELLCSWLEVPATPWPPNHYALLGLPPGQGTTDVIEQRVLERMELLRRYQLMHPEPVTEGMNLIAQAMICLTEPHSRHAYDRKLGVGSATADEPPILPEAIELAPEIEVPLALPPPTRPTRLAGGGQTVIATPRAEAPAEAEPLPDALLIPELVDEEPLPLPGEDDEAAAGPPPTVETRLFRPSELRRKLYADIVRIRRVLRNWEKLRTFLDDPEKAFARRTETVAFMACLAELKPLLPTVADLIGGTNQPGNLVAVLSRQQLVVEMFRSLLPSQRDSLTTDCRHAHYILLERYRDLRAEVQRQTAKNFARRVWYPLGREIISRPEWVILLIGVAALALAFVRSMPK